MSRVDVADKTIFRFPFRYATLLMCKIFLYVVALCTNFFLLNYNEMVRPLSRQVKLFPQHCAMRHR